MTDDLDHLLEDAQTDFPKPDPRFTDTVLRHLLDSSHRPSRGRIRGGRFVATAIVIGGLAFALGHWLAPSAGTAASAKLFDASVNGKRTLTISCTSSVMVYLDPEGRVTVLEYYFPPSGTPSPTGRVLAYIDSATRSLTRVCPAISAPKLWPNTLVGPWPRDVASRIFCGGARKSRFQQIEVTPVVNRAKRVVGNRLLVIQDRHKVVEARITRHGGGISLDPSRCFRNESGIP